MSDNTVTIADLAGQIAAALDLPKSRVKQVLDLYGEIAGEALAEGARVRVPGLGTLHVVEVPERTGTVAGRDYHAPAHRAAKFRPGGDLKRAINP